MPPCRTRYLYIKNGDVIAQLKAIEDMNGKVPDGGPDAFLAGFLNMIGTTPVLLLSVKSRGYRISKGNIEARVFPYRIRGIGILGGPSALAFMFVMSLVEALRFRPHRIICGTSGLLLCASYLLAGLLGSPLIHSRHNSVELNASSFRRRVHSKLDKWVLRRVRAVICHGPYLRNQIRALGVKEQVILMFDCGLRGFVEENRHSSVPLLPAKRTNKVVLYLGRIEMNKGVSDLLQACEPRLQEDRSLRLVYAGTGEALTILRKRVRDMKLTQQVVFMGKVAHNQVGSLIKQARLLVVPTRSSFPEGRCMAAMEGLALGVPVVAPDFGPFPHLIKDGENGLLFEPDSIHDLRAKLLAVLDDHSLREELSEGAKDSGERLLDPPMRFAEAVRRAFEIQESGRCG